MPSVKPVKKYFSHKSTLRKLLCILFFSVFGLIVFLSVLFKQSYDRVLLDKSYETKLLNEETKPGSANARIEPRFAPLDEDISKLAVPPQAYDEWCQARDYIDLSEDPVFKNFENWIDQYQALTCAIDSNCSIHLHDPRRVAQFMDEGLNLAKHRAQILQQIIRGDPRKALELALDEMRPISSLPEPFAEYTEKWVNEFADIEAIHSCYDLNHPKIEVILLSNLFYVYYQDMVL